MNGDINAIKPIGILEGVMNVNDQPCRSMEDANRISKSFRMPSVKTTEEHQMKNGQKQFKSNNTKVRTDKGKNLKKDNSLGTRDIGGEWTLMYHQSSSRNKV